MKPGGGRAKGAKAELDVCRLFTKWWSPLETGAKFKRTPGSGGWGGREGADTRGAFRASGDLMTTAKRWPFGVEVKCKEKWSVESFLKGNDSPVYTWFDQACAASNELNASAEPGVALTQPLLVFRKNHVEWRALLIVGTLAHPFRPDAFHAAMPGFDWCWLSVLLEIPPSSVAEQLGWW